MNKISKNELIKKLNSYNIIEINEELEDNIGFYRIIFGEYMTKVNKMDFIISRLNNIDLVLQEMRQGISQINARLDNLEKDVSLIKQCPTIKQELSNL